MLSLLALTLALSAPAMADPVAAAAMDQRKVDPGALVQMQLDSPDARTEEPAREFDRMAIHPDPEVCYKIRAFLFSKGRDPKLIRETTCGPKAANSRQTDGYKLVPLDEKANQNMAPKE